MIAKVHRFLTNSFSTLGTHPRVLFESTEKLHAVFESFANQGWQNVTGADLELLDARESYGTVNSSIFQRRSLSNDAKSVIERICEVVMKPSLLFLREFMNKELANKLSKLQTKGTIPVPWRLVYSPWQQID